MQRKLLIVWSTAEIAVARNMVLLYSSVMMERDYWDEAHLMIWGPSAKVLAEEQELQTFLQKIQQSGVHTSACQVCTDEYGVTQKLEALGVEITHTGEFMTYALQHDWKVITF